MPRFRIYVETKGREEYVVVAPDESVARGMFYNGDAGEPSISEVLDAEIWDVDFDKPSPE